MAGLTQVLGGAFDASQEEERQEYEALDPGEYPAWITASAFEANKAGSGQFLKLEIEVIDGPRKGAKLFDRLNLVNPNEVAVKIARQTLAEICRAVGKLNVADSEELHVKPLVVKVAKVPRKKDGVAVPGEFSNEIKGYKPAGSGAAAGGAVAAKANAAVAGAAASKPSWMAG